MALPVRLKQMLLRSTTAAAVALSGAETLLASETNGLAFDFTDITASQPYGSGQIKDTVTPANTWATSASVNPFDKLTWTGASLRMNYGSDGTLKFAPHNLFLRSQEINNGSWNKSEITVSADAANAPDATATADNLVPSTNNTGHYINQNVTVLSSTPYTARVRAKASGYQWFAIGINEPGVSTHLAYFDLTNGAVGSKSAGVTSTSIEALGDGWYLCTYTKTTSSSQTNSFIHFYVANADPGSGNVPANFAGNGTDGILVWGAQLQRTPVHSTDYIATTSAAVYRPRIDYDPSTLAVRGLLMEEARTNSILRSAEFDNASWLKADLTVTANNTTSPDGTATAEKLDDAAATAQHFTAQIFTGTAVAWTYSVFLKDGDRRYAQVYFSEGGNDYGVSVDLQAGTIGTATGAITSSSITSVGNGWYRVAITKTLTASANWYACVGLAAADGSIRANYAGTNKYIYAWGAQVEIGAFPTSYIPTTSASATRAASTESLASTLFNLSATAGTIYISGITASGKGTHVVASLDDGTANERFRLVRDSSGNIRFITTDGGVEQCNIDLGVVADSTAFKVALSWAANDFAVSLNGGAVVTDTGGTLPTVNTLRFGCSSSGEQFCGHIKQGVHVPRTFSDAELIARST